MLTEQKNIVPGVIVEGKVQGVTKFGAFVELPGGAVGLVHISEIADTYVKNVRDFIQEGESVRVKVLNVSEGKIGLSIKQALLNDKKEPVARKSGRNEARGGRDAGPSDNRESKSRLYKGSEEALSLDDKIAKFLKESDERMQPLKNKFESKRRNRHN
ncbi:MAG: S1 RNA-binding domain-containing protein [Syntrophomonadaceae bacterium]|nr:S1 RNA-binding domain-containing protein [Syntrophomonadaceae bacterium]